MPLVPEDAKGDRERVFRAIDARIARKCKPLKPLKPPSPRRRV
jgi:hypothetical protein